MLSRSARRCDKPAVGTHSPSAVRRVTRSARPALLPDHSRPDREWFPVPTPDEVFLLAQEGVQRMQGRGHPSPVVLAMPRILAARPGPRQDRRDVRRPAHDRGRRCGVRRRTRIKRFQRGHGGPLFAGPHVRTAGGHVVARQRPPLLDLSQQQDVTALGQQESRLRCPAVSFQVPRPDPHARIVPPRAVRARATHLSTTTAVATESPSALRRSGRTRAHRHPGDEVGVCGYVERVPWFAALGGA
jgi:hypothetical protein